MTAGLTAVALDEIRGLIRDRDELLKRSPVCVPRLNAAQARLADKVPALLAAVDAVQSVIAGLEVRTTTEGDEDTWALAIACTLRDAIAEALGVSL